MKKFVYFALSLMLIVTSSILFAGCGENEQNNGFVPVVSVRISNDGNFNDKYPIEFESYYSVELENETEVSEKEFADSSYIRRPDGTWYMNNKKTLLEYVGKKCKYLVKVDSYQNSKYYFATIKSVEEQLVKFKALDDNKIEIIDTNGNHYLYNASCYKVAYFI